MGQSRFVSSAKNDVRHPRGALYLFYLKHLAGRKLENWKNVGVRIDSGGTPLQDFSRKSAPILDLSNALYYNKNQGRADSVPHPVGGESAWAAPVFSVRPHAENGDTYGKAVYC